MSCLIILNGECFDCGYLKKLCNDSEYIICADGGLKHLSKINESADIAVGDFDSSEKPDSIETVVYPAEKDLTDFEIALKFATDKGFKEIKVTCALGGRRDHEMANIMLLTHYPKAFIEDEQNLIFLVDKNKLLEGYSDKTLSIVPTETSVISLNGFKYNLENKEIRVGDTLTMSNIILSEKAEISVLKGKILVFINK